MKAMRAAHFLVLIWAASLRVLPSHASPLNWKDCLNQILRKQDKLDLQFELLQIERLRTKVSQFTPPEIRAIRMNEGLGPLASDQTAIQIYNNRVRTELLLLQIKLKKVTGARLNLAIGNVVEPKEAFLLAFESLVSVYPELHIVGADLSVEETEIFLKNVAYTLKDFHLTKEQIIGIYKIYLLDFLGRYTSSELIEKEGSKIRDLRKLLKGNNLEGLRKYFQYIPFSDSELLAQAKSEKEDLEKNVSVLVAKKKKYEEESERIKRTLPLFHRDPPMDHSGRPPRFDYSQNSLGEKKLHCCKNSPGCEGCPRNRDHFFLIRWSWIARMPTTQLLKFWPTPDSLIYYTIKGFY